MSLHIINDTDKVELGPSADGTYEGAMGGTELMNKALHERVPSELLDQFNIIKSRVRHVDTDKQNILWLHDTWNDPESQHLRNVESRERFSKLVFVSNHQLSTYHMAHGIPYSETVVLKNAIEPIDVRIGDKPKDQIRLIYHTTPHRGLNILVAAVKALAEEFGDTIHLDVYSSFEAYGWKERDEEYKNVFQEIDDHPNMTNHGYKPNGVIRAALKQAHIFAYPNIWPETSCIAAIEAMSAGCEIVCPNYGALPETTGNFARMYNYRENIDEHANVFTNELYMAIKNHRNDHVERKLDFQKNWTDNFFNWDYRAAEWQNLLENLSREK